VTEQWTGTLRKMRVADTDPVSYSLADGRHDESARVDDLPLAPFLGRPISLRFTGEINCTACGRPTKKTFSQGYCWPCSQSLAAADICMVKPELCHHGDAEHPCREEDFAQSKCFRPHILYVSLTSGCKVGITRKVNVPDRWIDQGAVAAMPLAELPDRRTVGLLEHELAATYADNTHWMRMLKEERPEADLEAFAAEVLAALEARGVEPLPAAERAVRIFNYPVLSYPQKVRSWNLDKSDEVDGVLDGIKGQYLILDTGVINLRKFTGYRISFHGEKR